MASLVVQWTHVLHEDSDVHQDPSLPANVDETYFLQVASCTCGRLCFVVMMLRACLAMQVGPRDVMCSCRVIGPYISEARASTTAV